MSPSRLKFELIESQQQGGAKPARSRSNAAAPRLEHSASGHSGVLMELASGLDFLIAQLAKAEDTRTEMEAERDELRNNLETVEARLDEVQVKASAQQGVIAEQQKALLLSMELMRRLEDEMGSLRTKVENLESNAAAPAPAPTREPELEAAIAERDARILKLEESDAKIVALNEKIASLESALSAKDGELQQLRQDLEKAKADHAGTPGLADIRALETQRDQARAEAATARADLSIQSAELESKEELIAALERALEQQHGSLRSLEERLGTYSARLQEIRMDRLTMPGATAADPEESPGLMAALKGLFSPAPRSRKEPAD